MHRNAHPTAPSGHHTDGDPSRGIGPTIVPAATMEALQEEICAVIENQKIPLDKNNNKQLLQAIIKLVSYQVTIGDFVTHDEFDTHAHSQYELKTNLKQGAYRDVGSGADQVAAGDHAHSQYELKTSLKQGAYRDVGSGAGQVAAGDHAHSQYELKTSLKQGAYRDVGTGAGQVAAGDHTHGDMSLAILGIRFTSPIIRQINEGDHVPEVPGALVTAVSYAEYLNETTQSYRLLQIFQGGVWKTVAY